MVNITRSWLITGFVARLIRRVSLMEQELLTLSDHFSSLSFFSGVRVTRSLVLYVCFVDRYLSFCTFSFGHCVFCSSLIYDSDYSFGIFKLFLLLVNCTTFLVDCTFYSNSVILQMPKSNQILEKKLLGIHLSPL